MSFSTIAPSTDFEITSVHRKVKSLIKDPLLVKKPIDSRPTGEYFKSNFASYLSGELNANTLIQTLNYPRLNPPTLPSPRTQQHNKIASQRRKTEARMTILKSKVGRIKDLILEKVQQRKPENEILRLQNAQNMALVQTIIDLANNKETSKPYQAKLIPKCKSLSAYKLKFDNVTPICQLQKLEQQYEQQPCYLKTVMDQNSKLYLEEINKQNQIHQNNMLRCVRLNIQQRKKNAKHEFKLFHQAAASDRRNLDGILTQQDVQLYDYLFSKPQSFDTKNLKYMQNVIESPGSELRMSNTLRKYNKPQRRTQQHYNMVCPENSDDSCASSLQSACEIELDNFYTEARAIKNKPQVQLARRIKQLMNLEEISKKSVHITLNRLDQ